MSWFAQNKDFVAIIVATLAVIVSLVTVLVQRRYQQLDAYRQIYEVLMSPDIHRGRWEIIDIGRTRKVPGWDSPELFVLFRTLGQLNALATYYHHRIVPRRLVRKIWRYPLMDMREGITVIRNAEIARIPQSGRIKRPDDWEPWADLWWLLEKLPSEPSSEPSASPVEPAATAGTASGDRGAL
jgi:hypothetical protein